MSNKTIYDALLASGMTKEGACGLMGNMMAESGMKSNIAQRGMTKLTDEQYTAAADNNLMDFVHDSCGFGLCQWTYFSRKQSLMSFAKKCGVSVGDEAMQVQFCIQELRKDFPGVWEFLCSSHDTFQCAQKVCLEYERPAVNNVGTRFAFADEFFKEFAESISIPHDDYIEPKNDHVDFTVAVIQFLMKFNDPSIWPYEIDGLKSKKFFDALREFTDAMEAC